MSQSGIDRTSTTNMTEDDRPDDNLPNVQPVNDINKRPACKFGRKCFRQNPIHRVDMAHPGDADYTVPDMPDCSENAAKCKYGAKCYRLNPEHFKNFKHPRNIDLQQNYKKYILKHQSNRRNSDSSLDYDVSDDDPFSGDSGGSEYLPSDDD